MAKEVLYIPEDDLKEVIKVVRVGLEASSVSSDVREFLTMWCDEEEAYLARLGEE